MPDVTQDGCALLVPELKLQLQIFANSGHDPVTYGMIISRLSV
jgi:hypothetical protein